MSQAIVSDKASQAETLWMYLAGSSLKVAAECCGMDGSVRFTLVDGAGKYSEVEVDRTGSVLTELQS